MGDGEVLVDVCRWGMGTCFLLFFMGLKTMGSRIDFEWDVVNYWDFNEIQWDSMDLNGIFSTKKVWGCDGIFAY